MDMHAQRAIGRCTPYNELPEYLSPEECRAFLDIGRSTMYDLLRRDEIPHVRFGRCIRIPKASLRPAGIAEVE
jgi:excisionase family DNA binding protein